MKKVISILLMILIMTFTRADETDLSEYCVEKNTAEFYSSAELKSAGLFMNEILISKYRKRVKNI